jgi:hypothetical protein
MGAFKPSDDETHDLGTTSERWQNVHADKIVISGADNNGDSLTSTIGGTLSVSNLTVTGTTSGISSNLNVTDPGNTDAYTVAADDFVIFHAGNVNLPIASDHEGRELVIINKNTEIGPGNDITIKPDEDNDLYAIGDGITAADGYALSPKRLLRLVSSGTAWYAIFG